MSRGVLFRLGLCNMLIGFGLGCLAASWALPQAGMEVDAIWVPLSVASLGTGLFGHALNFVMFHLERIQA